jgi:hypothetical protein
MNAVSSNVGEALRTLLQIRKPKTEHSIAFTVISATIIGAGGLDGDLLVGDFIT